MATSAADDRIERVLAGDRAAFDALYGQCLALVWQRAAACCDDRAAAEALTARVLAHAFRRLAERPAGVALPAWLAALTRELAAPRRARPAGDGAAPRHAGA